MYDLIHIKNNTYYISSPSNIGLYVEQNQVTLIDSGSDKSVAKKVLRLLQENDWTLKTIINTHSHADHIGGNAFLQAKTNCNIVATTLESFLINQPELEATFLYGAKPHYALLNKFLHATKSNVTHIVKEGYEAFRLIPLPGHYLEMVGVITPDNVCFLADSVFSERIIQKYPLFFLIDVKAFLETLEMLLTLECAYYLPSHGELVDDINDIVIANRNNVFEIIAFIKDSCQSQIRFETLFKRVLDHYDIKLDINQSVLANVSIKAYLTYLIDNHEIEYLFVDNQQYYIIKGV